MSNDLDALDRLFSPGDYTMRGDGSGLLIGHEEISAFRARRGGAPRRRLLRVEVRPVSANAAIIVAIVSPDSGGRGQQTQLWTRIDADSPWTIDVAHVSQPTPALNSTIWRTVGTPLVSGSASGPLAGETVAVKDLFSVAGFPVGAGVPGFLAEQDPASETASSVCVLLDAGADVRGIARTDEFAFSISGRNIHYGTPPNPAVIDGIPGGSSSGPASAVSMGQASIGLGTDTGGSIRVPASYQGLWGLRTTHGAVATDGLLPLAPSFDTIGWLTRDISLLDTVAASYFDKSTQVAVDDRFAVNWSLVSRADPAVVDAFSSFVNELDRFDDVEFGDPGELLLAFRTIQAAEAWRTHGPWISLHPGALASDVESRFRWGSTITPDQEDAAREQRSAATSKIQSALDGRILLLPSASSVAPPTNAEEAEYEATRAATLGLNCIAGLLGAPALSAPLLEVHGAPVGLCLVGPRFGDRALLKVGASLADR